MNRIWQHGTWDRFHLSGSWPCRGLGESPTSHLPWLWSLATSCGMCGWRSGNGTDLVSALQFFSVSIILLILCTVVHSCISFIHQSSIISVTRSIIKPKHVNHSLSLSPLLSMKAMYHIYLNIMAYFVVINNLEKCGGYLIIVHVIKYSLCRYFPENLKTVKWGHLMCIVIIYSGKYSIFYFFF